MKTRSSAPNQKSNAYHPCDSDTFTALIDFRSGHPAFLSELERDPLSSWQVEMGDDDDTSFDLHFLGFTQLYPTADGKPIRAK